MSPKFSEHRVKLRPAFSPPKWATSIPTVINWEGRFHSCCRRNVLPKSSDPALQIFPELLPQIRCGHGLVFDSQRPVDHPFLPVITISVHVHFFSGFPSFFPPSSDRIQQIRSIFYLFSSEQGQARCHPTKPAKCGFSPGPLPLYLSGNQNSSAETTGIFPHPL